MATPNGGPQTERVLRLYEKEAHKYDRQMRFFEWLLFGGGREWVCSQAEGEGLEIDLRVGDAQALEFPDERFDSVVCTLSLCTIPDDRAAVAEVRRVLRPGGHFLLLEHVRSPLLPIRTAERLLEPLMLRFEADHLLREPLEHLRAEGFAIERLERAKLGIVERVAARKPAPG